MRGTRNKIEENLEIADGIIMSESSAKGQKSQEPKDKNMKEASSRVTENPEIKCDESIVNADTDTPAPGESLESATPSPTPAYWQAGGEKLAGRGRGTDRMDHAVTDGGRERW